MVARFIPALRIPITGIIKASLFVDEHAHVSRNVGEYGGGGAFRSTLGVVSVHVTSFFHRSASIVTRTSTGRSGVCVVSVRVPIIFPPLARVSIRCRHIIPFVFRRRSRVRLPRRIGVLPRCIWVLGSRSRAGVGSRVGVGTRISLNTRHGSQRRCKFMTRFRPSHRYRPRIHPTPRNGRPRRIPTRSRNRPRPPTVT